ncbi:two-component response regulator OmpR subfamily protein [Chondrocystis sp. NIES-4102]|nr:two-component response regulator OmpR subfamily protein [Chondrocystis sp. NIES-4102]
MISAHISIVESNPHLRSLLGWHLQQAGYTVSQSASIQQGRDTFYRHQPALVIIDSDLPDGDGLELSHWIYQQQKSLILLLSARNNEQDIVRGLKTGADDYLTKPFGMQEFLARVETLLRRVRISNTVPLSMECKDLKIDLAQRRVQLKGNFIELTPQEFSLLYVLAQAQGNPLSRSELLERAWPEDIDNPRTVDTHVLSLRKKIELNPRQPHIIQTVRNVGYCFNPELIENTTHTSETKLTTAVVPSLPRLPSRV